MILENSAQMQTGSAFMILDFPLFYYKALNVLNTMKHIWGQSKYIPKIWNIVNGDYNKQN